MLAIPKHINSTSLVNAELPFASSLSDEDLIEKAMQARVSSKGRPTNEGVGLSLSAQLVELMGGDMLVVSGAGKLMRSRDRVMRKARIEHGAKFPGTLIAISFPRNNASNFTKNLEEAKNREIPLPHLPGSGSLST